MNGNFFDKLIGHLFTKVNADFKETIIIVPNYLVKEHIYEKIYLNNIKKNHPIYLPKVLTLSDYIKSKSKQNHTDSIHAALNLYRYIENIYSVDMCFFNFFPLSAKIFETFSFLEKYKLEIDNLKKSDINLPEWLDLELFKDVYCHFCKFYNDFFHNTYEHDSKIFIDTYLNCTVISQKTFIFILDKRLEPQEIDILKILHKQFSKFFLIQYEDIYNLNHTCINLDDIENIVIRNDKRKNENTDIYEVRCKNEPEQVTKLQNLLLSTLKNYKSAAIVLNNPNNFFELLLLSPLKEYELSFDFNISIKSTYAYKLLYSLLKFYRKYCSSNSKIKKSDLTEIFWNPILNTYLNEFIRLNFYKNRELHLDIDNIVDKNIVKILKSEEKLISNRIIIAIESILECSREYLSDTERQILEIVHEKIKDISTILELEEPINRKLDFIIDILSKQVIKVKKKSSKNQIEIISYENISINQYDILFFLEFEEGTFPQIQKNNTILSSNFVKNLSDEVDEQRIKFLRLLSGSQKSFLIYSEDKSEISRFNYHVILNDKLNYEKLEFCVDTSLYDAKPIIVEKDASVLKKLNALNLFFNCQADFFSPTMLNNYIDCPLKFYFQYIEKLRPHPYNLETSVQKELGIDLHQICKEVYSDISSSNNLLIDEEIIKKHIPFLSNLVKNKLKSKYLNFEGVDLSGELAISQLLIENFITQLMIEDLKYVPFEILSLEDSEYLKKSAVSLFSKEKECGVRFGGVIDRIDKLKNNTIRIIDYKTGKANLKISSIDSLFNKNSKTRQKDCLQVLLYSYIIYRSLNNNSVAILPNILYISPLLSGNRIDATIKIKKDKDYVNIMEISPYVDNIEQNVLAIIEEIFDHDIPFIQTENIEKCLTCNFSKICKRK